MGMQENFQTMLHNALRDLANNLRHDPDRRRIGEEEDSTDGDENPFADEENRRDDGADRGYQDRGYQDRGYQDRGNRNWERGFKVDLPEFHGGVRGEELLDWLVTVQEMLEFMQVPENRKVPLVATKFRGKAASWGLQLKASRVRAGKESIQTWAKLEKVLRKTFLPYNFDRTMFTRLQNLRQGSRSVDDYTEEFSLLLTRNDILDSEIQLVSRFIGGLRPQIQNAMSQFDPLTVAEAYRRAVAFELQFKPGSSNWNSAQRARSTALAGEGEQLGANAKDGGTGGGAKGAAAGKAPVTGDELRRSTRPNALRCYSCGEPGHLQTACPKGGRRGLLAKETKWDDDNEEDDGNRLEELTDDRTAGDQGTLLMLRRICLAPMKHDDQPWLRTNIFASTCTINGKVCSFVIDSGSCRNVISASAADKLGLRKSDHPAPYRLVWLQQGMDVRVTHRVLVSLSNGAH